MLSRSRACKKGPLVVEIEYERIRVGLSGDIVPKAAQGICSAMRVSFPFRTTAAGLTLVSHHFLQDMFSHHLRDCELHLVGDVPVGESRRFATAFLEKRKMVGRVLRLDGRSAAITKSSRMRRARRVRGSVTTVAGSCRAIAELSIAESFLPVTTLPFTGSGDPSSYVNYTTGILKIASTSCSAHRPCARALFTLVPSRQMCRLPASSLFGSTENVAPPRSTRTRERRNVGENHRRRRLLRSHRAQRANSPHSLGGRRGRWDRGKGGGVRAVERVRDHRDGSIGLGKGVAGRVCMTASRVGERVGVGELGAICREV